jgi:DNA-directed RNA polymerase beta subunit
MVEDKWNARGEGRREQKTRLPTGGRGNQGGLRIGEMERDSLIAHSISYFIKETYNKIYQTTHIDTTNTTNKKKHTNVLIISNF